MKMVVENVPTQFIIFDNGAKEPLYSVLSDIEDMMDSGATDFNKKVLYDMAMLDIIETKYSDIIREKCDIGSYIRIYWGYGSLTRKEEFFDEFLRYDTEE